MPVYNGFSKCFEKLVCTYGLEQLTMIFNNSVYSNSICKMGDRTPLAGRNAVLAFWYATSHEKQRLKQYT